MRGIMGKPQLNIWGANMSSWAKVFRLKACLEKLPKKIPRLFTKADLSRWLWRLHSENPEEPGVEWELSDDCEEHILKSLAAQNGARKPRSSGSASTMADLEKVKWEKRQKPAFAFGVVFLLLAFHHCWSINIHRLSRWEYVCLEKKVRDEKLGVLPKHLLEISVWSNPGVSCLGHDSRPDEPCLERNEDSCSSFSVTLVSVWDCLANDSKKTKILAIGKCT